MVARTRLSVTLYVHWPVLFGHYFEFFWDQNNFFFVSSTYFAASRMTIPLAPVVTLLHKIRPLRPVLGRANPVPYTDALLYVSSRHLWETQMQPYPYSASALVEGGWPVPRPSRYNPRENSGTHCTGGWLTLGARLDGSVKSLALTRFRTSGQSSP